MPIRKQRHPDMNLNDLDYSITFEICKNLDIDKSWELLAGAIGYSTSAIQTFDLEYQRPNGSPTKKLLWDWGTRGATIRDLYDKLALINRIQSMRLLEHIVNPEKGQEKQTECKVDNSMPVDESLFSKSDNYSSTDNVDHNFYDTGSLPVPSMKTCRAVKEKNTVDVNFNMPDPRMEKTGNKPPMVDKLLGAVLVPPGAGASEMSYEREDGLASMKGNMGAASPAVRSFERVRSVIEDYGSEAMNMSDWSDSDRQIAQALMGTPNYTYKDLSIATDGFSVRNRLGQGKYGEVYYGIVKNTKCAIKKLTQRTERMADENSALQMAAELKALSRYRHENIVSLYGYTLDEDEVCLVYQYMTNGSLNQCLHCKPTLVLTWEQRLSILRGAACGLQFLHTVDRKPVIHGAIKSSNILLDGHFEAKIGDLGLAKQATGGEVTGKMTHITKKTTSIHDYRSKAYHAPEIARGNGFSIKGDSYAFGVVIFECLSGKEAFDERREGSVEHKYLVEYIQSALEDSPKLDKQKIFQDPKMKISFPATTFEVLINIAQRCTEDKKKDRPAMVEVYAEIDKCENNHDGPEYKNIQELAPEREKKIDAGSIHEHHMSVRNQPSYSPGLKSPPSASPNKSVPQSPIDLLPKDQPIPEAFKLQMQNDQRQKKASQEPDYINVDQMTSQMKATYLSDPAKLEKLENFDKENLPNLSGIGQVVPAYYRPGQPLENTETISDAEKDCLKGDSFTYEFASDPDKLKLIQEQKVGKMESSRQAAVGHCYQNYPNTDEENSSHPNNAIENSDTQAQEAGRSSSNEIDKVTDFSKEFDEITDKAMKGYGSMMGIFDKFHEQVVEEHLTNVGDVIDDNEEFDIQFDFDADSETSTLTESINNDLELNSADFNDDALFASENSSPYANVQGNIDASLEEHQRKLAMYQGMTRNDSEELHERSSKSKDFSQSPCENKAESRFPQTGEDYYQNCSPMIKDQGHCEGKGHCRGQDHCASQASDVSNHSSVGYENRLDRENAGKMINIQELLQSREPTEGQCEEYV